MGYRSQVKIVVSKKGFYELKKYVESKAKEILEKLPGGADYGYDFNLLRNSDYIKIAGDTVIVSWNDIKWYEGSYDEVDAIMDGLNKILNEGYSYRYYRVGEEYGDIDVTELDGKKKENLDYLYVARYIEDPDMACEEKKYEDFDNLNGGI